MGAGTIVVYTGNWRMSGLPCREYVLTHVEGESMTASEPEGIPEEFRQKGPGIGERFPDVRLPDQIGAIVDLHKARDGRPALIVFYRSARW